MPLITCYARLSFYFSDLRSLLPRHDTNVNVLLDVPNHCYPYILPILCKDGQVWSWKMAVFVIKGKLTTLNTIFTKLSYYFKIFVYEPRENV